MKRTNWIYKIMGIAVVALPLTIAGGCAENVTQRDVSEAREEVAEEEQDVADAQREATENVLEEQQDVNEARREAMKPVAEDTEAIREEERDVAEAAREGNEAIREEQQDVREARKEAATTEAKFLAQNQRDAYIANAQMVIEQAEQKVSTLQNQADDADDANRDQLETRIDAIKKSKERAQDAIDDMKSAELLDWETHRAAVDQAITDLKQKLANA